MFLPLFQHFFARFCRFSNIFVAYFCHFSNIRPICSAPKTHQTGQSLRREPPGFAFKLLPPLRQDIKLILHMRHKERVPDCSSHIARVGAPESDHRRSLSSGYCSAAGSSRYMRVVPIPVTLDTDTFSYYPLTAPLTF